MKKYKMIKISKTNIYLICFFIFFLFFTIITVNNKSEANELIQIRQDSNYDINFCKSKKLMSICINFDKQYSIDIKLLNEPYRIILNFDKIIKISEYSIKKMNIKTDLIKKIRFGYPTRSVSRLVFDLDQPAIISEFFYKKDMNNKIINLQMVITKTSKASFSIAKHVLSQNNGNILDLNDNDKDVLDFQNKTNSYESKMNIFPKLKPKKTADLIKYDDKNKKEKKDNYIVFIDPGHGGRDPGAIGTLGTFEKDITLKVSLELAKALKKTNIITPILSRTTDIYLPLRKRIDLAKINKADIFISLHADASKNIAAKGISVFSLSDKASDKEAAIIAEKENAVDIIPGISSKISDPIIFGTLIKMIQRQAMNDSAFLARNIIMNLKKTKLAINRGHRFAGFAVLKAHDIPSILIEIGFISNIEEEKKMLSKKYLENLSKNLKIVIVKYLLKTKY